jgi:hypothetical protein
MRHRGVGVLTLDEANMLGARDEQHLAFGREGGPENAESAPRFIQRY